MDSPAPNSELTRALQNAARALTLLKLHCGVLRDLVKDAMDPQADALLTTCERCLEDHETSPSTGR